jgi:hypothetical protein
MTGHGVCQEVAVVDIGQDSKGSNSAGCYGWQATGETMAGAVRSVIN